MRVQGLTWMGVRSPQFAAMRRLFGEVMDLQVTRDRPGVTWFELPGGDEIQLYDDADVDHAFFGDGPVIGFAVEDVSAAIDDLRAAGLELIGPGDGDEERRWQHFRGPDGNVYEVIGPR